jgi:predicted Ser/Thr protein kinase
MEYACSQRKDLQVALWKATRDMQKNEDREMLTNVHKYVKRQRHADTRTLLLARRQTNETMHCLCDSVLSYII